VAKRTVDRICRAHGRVHFFLDSPCCGAIITGDMKEPGDTTRLNFDGLEICTSPGSSPARLLCAWPVQIRHGGRLTKNQMPLATGSAAASRKSCNSSLVSSVSRDSRAWRQTPQRSPSAPLLTTQSNSADISSAGYTITSSPANQAHASNSDYVTVRAQATQQLVINGQCVGNARLSDR